MRVSAAILAVVLGCSAALAQGDPRANLRPVTEGTKVKPKTKGAAKKEAAKKKTAKPDAEAKPEPAAKPKAKAAAAKPAKPAAKPATNGRGAAGTPSHKQSRQAAP